MPDRGLPVEPSEEAWEAAHKAESAAYAVHEGFPWHFALRAAYAVDASPALSLTREEAEATHNALKGLPVNEKAYYAARHKFTRFLQATEGQGDE